ncbi:MAG: iron chelate uptake ABC transporter family permease subunit [Pirellulales bacterium]
MSKCRPLGRSALVLASLLVALSGSVAASAAQPSGRGTITDRTVAWPTWPQWRRVVLLEDYNTRLVLAGTTLLGCAAGTVGSFTLLRKRSLMGDALSHATLPGIGIAFVATTLAGGNGKSLAVLLAGATISGIVGLLAILFIRNATRVKEDAALGIVLSVFFGAGVAVLGVAQQMETGHAAGLEAFIYGKTASMVPLDAQLIGAAGLIVAIVCLLLFKELRLLCFDETFGASRGYPVVALDIVLMGLVVTVTIIGLQAVGLILMIALLVVPACAARFWTERMSVMTIASAAIGALSALLGAGLSALAPNLPSGAMIVLVATCVFLVSMFFAPARGLVARAVRRRTLESKVLRQHLLRAIYERLDTMGNAPTRDESRESAAVAVGELLSMRSWSRRQLEKQIRQCERQGLLRTEESVTLRLTPMGCREAAGTTHRHRLWELFLIRYADVAPAQVDRDADAIEHVLDAPMVAELELLLRQQDAGRAVVASPHALDRPAGPAHG